jgi:hypothetical protein
MLSRVYSAGIRRDGARDQLPAGAVWDLVDYVPNVLGAPLRKRGPWSYGSDALGSSSYAAACAYADFTTGAAAVAIDNAGIVYRVNPATGAVTSEGAAVVPISPPQLHRDVLVIPSPDGTTLPQKYLAAGGAPAALAVTAPAGQYAAVYKDRTVLASVSGNEQRVYFGPGGAPTQAWDTTNSWIDASFPVVGLAAMRNVIVVFGAGRCERIRGNTPPPNTDMLREPLFDAGCIDARTIVPYGDNVIFANEQGIWLTDGAVPENLSKSSGMLGYWTDLLADYTASWTLAAGLHRGHYVISIMNGSAFVDAIALNVDARSWFRISNLRTSMFARAHGTSEELYFAVRTDAHLGKLSTIFTPDDVDTSTDGDGNAILPVLETGFFKDTPTEKRWHNLYVDYQLAGGSSPTLAIAYLTSPDATSYTTLSKALAQQTHVDRKRVPLRVRARGLAFRVTQTAASTDTRLHELEVEAHSLEGNR